MFLEIHHIVRRAAFLVGVPVGLGILSGCQAVVTSAPQSQVRIIDASPDAPGLDIYEGPNALAYNLGFGTLTSYIAIAPSNYTIAANTVGTRQTLSSSKATFAASAQYTVLIGNAASSLQQLVLTDQSQPAPDGQISLRFIDQATRIGALDVYLVPAGQKLTSVNPVLTGVVFGANTGYLNVPAGTYTLVMVLTGSSLTSTTVTAYAGAQVIYAPGAARTIILVDQQHVTTPGLQVITADDFDPSIVTN
jgi:hypothetical protein